MQIPKIIHFTIPEHPSDFHLSNINRARELHPGWEVVVWRDPVDPALFVLSKYWKKANSGAQLADLIRLEVVYQQGGFYLDADIELAKSLEPLRVFPFVICSGDSKVLANSFFGAPPNNPILKRLIDDLSENEVDWTQLASYTTGPVLFSREMQWRKDVTVVPRDTFYPYDWNEKATRARLWTYGTHHWEFSWRPSGGPRQPIRRLWRSIRSRMRRLAIGGIHLTRRMLIDAKQRLRVGGSFPYSAEGVLCAQTVHGTKIFLVGEDVSVTPFIALNGTYEFPEERFIQRIVRRGDWVIDVGANVGMFSLLCADKVGVFGRVFCYEPNPLPANLMKRSLVMNWFHDRVEVREAALGSEVGTSRLRFSREVLGGATLSVAGSAGTFENSIALVSDEQEIEVQVSTLDADFPANLPIRLLKIDAEGFEHHVLRGGRRLLENHCVEVLMLECSQEVYGDAWNEYLHEIRKLIASGYGTYRLTKSSKLREISYADILFADRDKNIFLVSKHAKDTIRELS